MKIVGEMDITVKRICKNSFGDINLPNEPFPLYGRMIPRFDGESWSYSVEELPKEQTSEMTFPDENYVYEDMKENSFFVGAYDGTGKCVGLAIYQKSWNRYLYLYDLKVNRDCRGRGIGSLLLEEGKRIAGEYGYRGIQTVGQDNNLGACLFYIKNGFAIGGLDTRVYTGTKQEGKSDILFYLDC